MLVSSQDSARCRHDPGTAEHRIPPREALAAGHPLRDRFTGFKINGAWKFAVIARTSSGTTRIESTRASDESSRPSAPHPVPRCRTRSPATSSPGSITRNPTSGSWRDWSQQNGAKPRILDQGEAAVPLEAGHPLWERRARRLRRSEPSPSRRSASCESPTSVSSLPSSSCSPCPPFLLLPCRWRPSLRSSVIGGSPAGLAGPPFPRFPAKAL